MKISDYNELFSLFDKIINTNSDDPLFDFKDETMNFRNIVSSYDKFFVHDPEFRLSSMRSHSGLFASVSLGLTSLINCPDRKLSRRYELSFLKVFPVLSSYIREPYNYHVYNLYTNTEEIHISRSLFVNDVNLAGFYKNKFFIVHNYSEFDENTPFITLLSPSVMFTDETNSFEFIED